MFATAIEVGGWFGGAMMVLVYVFVSTGKMKARSGSFQGLNIAGSALLGMNSGWHHAWPSLTINALWICVGVVVVACPMI